MILKDSPHTTNGNGRVLARVVPAAQPTRLGLPECEPAGTVHRDRPVYQCPNCYESAMQFFKSHESHPERSDFFYCQACGSCWEM